MFEIKAYPIALPESERTPDKLVHGWYVPVGTTTHCIIPSTGTHLTYSNPMSLSPAIEIDIKTAAVKTGRKDKHGTDIFGSMGDMQGGDRVKMHGDRASYPVGWAKQELTWVIGKNAQLLNLACWNPDELEIVPPRQKDNPTDPD